MDLSYITALFYGVASFFTPCILPMLPVYFGYLAGEAVTNLDEKNINRKLIMNAVGFSWGISFLNILLGFGARFISAPLQANSNLLRIIGGILLIIIGIYFIFEFKIMFLERERRIEYKHYSPTFIKSFILGITFSFGWTPCNGAIIASILLVASLQENYLRAGTLMLVYSIGFSTLFILSALFFSVAIQKFKAIYKYFGVIKKLSGALMIIMGILLITNYIEIFNFLQ